MLLDCGGRKSVKSCTKFTILPDVDTMAKNYGRSEQLGKIATGREDSPTIFASDRKRVEAAAESWVQ
jgi:hypothetical protein